MTDVPAPEGSDKSDLPESDVRRARETVDALEDEQVNVPEPDEVQVDPAAASGPNTGVPTSEKAGDAEPPD